MSVPAVRWVRHVSARHEAAVLGPVERQRAAAGRCLVDGVGELPQQPRPSPAGRRSAQPGSLSARAPPRRPPISAASCRSRTRRKGGSTAASPASSRSAPPGTTRCCCRRSTVRPTGCSFPPTTRLSDCISDIVNYEPSVAGIELTKPGDAAYDRGSCGATDQRHVVNLSTVYRVPGCVRWGARDADPRLAGIGDRGRAQRHSFRPQRRAWTTR